MKAELQKGPRLNKLSSMRRQRMPVQLKMTFVSWIGAAEFGPAEERGSVIWMLCLETVLTQCAITPPNPLRVTNSPFALGSLQIPETPARNTLCPPCPRGDLPGLPVEPREVRLASRVL